MGKNMDVIKYSATYNIEKGLSFEYGPNIHINIEFFK